MLIIPQGLESQINAAIEARLPHWVALLRQLVQTPSTYDKEHAILDLVRHQIDLLGVPVSVVPFDGRAHKLADAQPPYSKTAGRHNIVATMPGASQDGRSLTLNSHLDTVCPGDASDWTFPPYGGRIDASRNVIFGRGAMDDKAGVVISLALMDLMRAVDIRLAGDIVFQYVLEDETTGNGTLLCLADGFRSDAAIIIDGTRPNRGINQHAGQLEFTLTLLGRPVSVGVSHMRVNPAELLGEFVLWLKEAVHRLNEGSNGPFSRFPSPYQLVLRRFCSDSAAFTSPQSAEATCHLTFPPPWCLAVAKDFIEDMAKRFGHSRRLSKEIAVHYKGFSSEPVSSRSRELESVIQQGAGYVGVGEIDFGPSTGASDMRHFIAADIPCVLYGPGTGFNPHGADEHYHLDDLPRMVKLFVSVLLNWCGLA